MSYVLGRRFMEFGVLGSEHGKLGRDLVGVGR